ncbi:MAG: nicotinic acid mononucleotide adenylyltransferase [Blastopirellula sp.]|nr:MAG: nicotinic acid mononucleotide adenylyltransferase [Blastopirellula sp.]
MKLGIFGGSFSPVHQGHLLLAETCREQCQLDQVWFVPAATPPHKQSTKLASDQHRVAMLELAIAGNEAFKVSDIELQRGGISYTVDTLQHIREANPEAELYLLIGADSLEDLPTWHKIGGICVLALPVVIARAGQAEPNWQVLAPLVSTERLAKIEQLKVDVTPVGFSSTEIRNRVASGRSIRYQLPRSVEKYIETQKLYLES